jgi:hypothetical protein
VSALLEAALAAAKRLWKVLPIFNALPDGTCACGWSECRNCGKHPLRDLVGDGQTSATSDPELIRNWWTLYPEASLAVVMRPSGLIAFDVDLYNGDGEKLDALQATYGTLPDTAEQISGSGKGAHLIYRAPEFAIRGQLGGITLRGNNYIVLAPSLHKSGGRYAWERSPDEWPIVDLPPAWLEAIRKPDPVVVSHSPEECLDGAGIDAWATSTGPLTDNDVARLSQELRDLGPRGAGNDTTFAAIAAIFHNYGRSVIDGEPFLREWNEHNGNPFDDGELLRQRERISEKDLKHSRGCSTDAARGWLKHATEPTNKPEPVTHDQIEAYYKIELARLRHSNDVLERVDAKWLERICIRSGTGKPLWNDGEDHDEALRACALALVRRAPGGTNDLQLGWLLVRYVGTPDRAAPLIAEARQVFATAPSEVTLAPAHPAATDDEAKSQAVRLLAIVKDVVELFHTPGGDAYATVPLMRDAVTTHRIDSRNFRDWLDYVYHVTTGGAVSDQARQQVVSILRTTARFSDDEHPVFVRVGHCDGRTYVDLSDGTGRAVEIDGDGWRVVARPPVHFVRPPGLLELPEPQRDPTVTIARLWDFVHVDPDDQIRVLAWLIGSLNSRGPYYVLVLTGRHGSIKSSAQKALRQLVDPNEAPLRLHLGDGRDIMISALASWIQSYDNLGPINDDPSNALCCLATGGAYATRSLHTDADETILKAQRPTIVNGIEDIVTAGDLLDRAIRIDCPVFAGVRRAEADIDTEFRAVHPALLGALLDVVSHAIRSMPAVAARSEIAWPRMADAAMFAAAAAPAIGYKVEEVVTALCAGAVDDHQIAIDSSPIAHHIITLADKPQLPTTLNRRGFSGTARELLRDLNTMWQVGDPRRPDGWPKDPTRLAGALKRIAPALESVGVFVTFPGRKRPKVLTISRSEPKS